ncbi:MAG: VOC family protein [Pseudomonadota bacterium]
MPNYWYDHIHLISPDSSKTAQFYQRMFNARMVSSRELDLNGSRILITERTAQPEPATGSPQTGYGIEHFGIRTDNLEAAVADLKAQGVKFRDEIRVARPGVKISYLWAPENVLIELLERSE